ncbi:hypothetical protein DIPPA_10679 [Diplonema papillatum]|nr:hypothetical protein DIPPA_10679 [Diplonema papillatum]|eukprot:gene3595-5578_t
MEKKTLRRVAYAWAAVLCLLSLANHQRALAAVEEAKREYGEKEEALRQLRALREKAEAAVARAGDRLREGKRTLHARRQELSLELDERQRAVKAALRDLKSQIPPAADSNAAAFADRDLLDQVQAVRKALAPAKAFADTCAASLSDIARKQAAIAAQWPAWFREGRPVYHPAADDSAPEPESWDELRELHEKYNVRPQARQPGPPESLASLYKKAKEMDLKQGGSGVILDATRYLQTHGRR